MKIGRHESLVNSSTKSSVRLINSPTSANVGEVEALKVPICNKPDIN